MDDAQPTPKNAAAIRLGPAFARLWTSAGFSNLADGIFKVVLPLVAVRYTREPALIAGLTFALTLPWLLFALVAGAMADRFDRRVLMLVANVIRATLLAALAALAGTGLGSIWLLYILAFLAGTAETVYDTSAQSILPQIVPRSLLPRANGRLYSVELTANQFVGPSVGGFLVAAGTVIAFATPAGLWVLAIVALLLLRGSFTVARTRSSTVRSDIAEGLRFLWHQRVLRTFAVVVGVSNFATNAAWSILVLFAVGPSSAMGLSDQAYGLLLTTVAVGSLVGSVLAEHIERWFGRARALLAGFALAVLVIAAPALSANVYWVGAAFAVGGVAMTVWNVITVSLRQRMTPDAMLGRLNSAYRLVAWGTQPLGAAVGGLCAQRFGITAVFWAMAALSLVMLVPIARISDRTIEAAIAASEGKP